MNPGTCVVLAYCVLVLAMNSVTGLRGRELVTALCSPQSDSTAGPDGLSPQHLKDLIFWSGSNGGFDRLSPQELKDLHDWSSSPGIFDGLSSQQLMDRICLGAGVADDLKLPITSTPFKFGYKHRDFLQMDISFKLPSDVTGGFVSLQYSLTDHVPKRTFEIRRPYNETDDPVVHVRDFIWGERVYIDVKLFNKTGVRLNERISEGSVVNISLNSNDMDYIHSPICLNGNRCQVKVDLRKECEDAEISEKPAFNYIVFISSLIFAIAIFVLLIVAFIKRCWIKRDAPETLQMRLQPKNPFYVNLLFRRECQEIINDLEQNHYELVD